MAEDPAKAPVADLLDSIRWDYDPEADQLSPLVSTERYFRDFPWEPVDVIEPRPEPLASTVDTMDARDDDISD